MKKKKQQGSCESCLYYEYEEDRFYDCPYYRLGDEYMIVRKQM